MAGGAPTFDIAPGLSQRIFIARDDADFCATLGKPCRDSTAHTAIAASHNSLIRLKMKNTRMTIIPIVIARLRRFDFTYETRAVLVADDVDFLEAQIVQPIEAIAPLPPIPR